MAYDALGRLIAARWPYATVTLSTGQPQVLMKVERYYYDGVRRLQTIVGNETMENDVVSVPPESWQTESEYVYGPDYVDEFVLQSSPNGQAGTVTQGVPADGQRRFYMLQDANYNVMAILDESGGVLEQYQWDPYGTLAVKDTLVSSGPTNRVGHQGLFFHRFDSGTGGPFTTTATGLYYNRNRWYSPKLGRFTSKDPNESGQVVISTLAMNGESPSATVDSIDAESHFSDGFNQFEHLGSAPLQRVDALGLSFEDDINNAILGVVADHANAYATTKVAMREISIGNRRAMAYAAAAFFWDELVWDEGEGKLYDLVLAGFFARACFVGDTRVGMADGSFKAIQDMRVGDYVKCDNDPSAKNGPEVSCVVGVSRRLASELAILRLKYGTYCETIEATPEHPFYVPASDSYVLAKDLRPGILLCAADGSPIEVESVDRRVGEVEVYNLEIRGAHNYYVSDAETAVCVLVHNACSGKKMVKLLERRGFRLDRIARSSHHIMKGPNGQTVSVPVHGNKDLGKGLLCDILKDAGLTAADLGI